RRPRGNASAAPGRLRPAQDEDAHERAALGRGQRGVDLAEPGEVEGVDRLAREAEPQGGGAVLGGHPDVSGLEEHATPRRTGGVSPRCPKMFPDRRRRVNPNRSPSSYAGPCRPHRSAPLRVAATRWAQAYGRRATAANRADRVPLPPGQGPR